MSDIRERRWKRAGSSGVIAIAVRLHACYSYIISNIAIYFYAIDPDNPPPRPPKQIPSESVTDA
ncbi:hypothetical protein P167DRAFT_535508 [Morchella conica CCBAS932]|uniref:Uncharacterized protein n=1 Tax=Morchella conica CCBAS932 TaxID=1392247 RepID=A0A3N4L427_9PEZI|nr:hypothetical protein P167DRAFT_535508 [Morchella conica CCBAS932]